MKATRTIMHCGGGGVISVDEIEVESAVLIGGPHNGRVVEMVNVLDDEFIMLGNVTCVYSRTGKGRFEFDHYREPIGS